VGRGFDDDVTKPYSVAFKQKMIERLTEKRAVSATQLARETGVRQQNLSRWLGQAHSLPLVADKLKRIVQNLTVERKASVIAAASTLTGEELTRTFSRL
jgi:transposase-like protein